jgi:hypothetical protein
MADLIETFKIDMLKKGKAITGGEFIHLYEEFQSLIITDFDAGILEAERVLILMKWLKCSVAKERVFGK